MDLKAYMGLRPRMDIYRCDLEVEYYILALNKRKSTKTNLKQNHQINLKKKPGTHIKSNNHSGNN